MERLYSLLAYQVLMELKCIKIPNLKVNVMTLRIHQSGDEYGGTACINYY